MTTFAQSEVNRIKLDIEVIQNDIRALEERLQQTNLTALQRGTAQRNLDRARARLAELQTELVAAERRAANEPTPQPSPPATAAQTARDDGPQGPNAPPPQQINAAGRVSVPANTGATNAAVTPTQENPQGITSGTDAPVKPTEQTQAITTASNSGVPPRDPAATVDAATVASNAAPVIEPGVAAKKDDATTPGSQQAAVDVGESAGPNVKPRPNVLDQYASYSYSASVYLLTEVQYARLLNSNTKRIDGYQLLFQSGGAANNVGGPRPPGSFDDADPSQPNGGRNPYFDNDFYIDSITITNLPPGKGSGSAHNVSELKFTVVEPLGITLLDRLYDAVANSQPKENGKVNYTVATYLMVIRFYGYDSEGNLEQVRTKPDQEGTSDPSAIVEKFIPFRIKSINWSVESKLVSYEWDCVPVGQLIGGFASRGTIPYDVQLVDSTVGGLLGGDVAYSGTASSAANPGASTTAAADNDPRNDPRAGRGFNRAAPTPTATPARNARDAQRQAIERQAGVTSSAPPKANAAPSDKKTITRGLVGAMNEFQAKLVKDGVFTFADEYVINFVGPEANKIKDAKLQLPNAKVAKRMTASAQAPTQDAQLLDQARTSVDMVSRSFSITAGQQLLQAIELTIRNSSYIYDQATVIINPDGTQTANPNSRNKPLKWFVITMSAEPISPKIDPKRNDYAYRITYTVAAREVKNVISKYFPVSRFTGVHKSYPYWFTGQNVAVLDYKETLNALYQLTVSGSDTESSLAARTREAFTSSMADIVTYNYAPRSTESSSGAAGKENELGANAAEVLYSPGDLREAKLRIVGDPAWIMQGSDFRVLTDESVSGDSLTSGFLPDGSIAFDNQDVLFEIVWQRPEDYDLESGLADPYSQTQKKYNNRVALQSRVYLCKKVVSEFRQGRFEQTLEGAIYQFPVPNKTNAANPAAANSATDDPRFGTRDDPRQGRGFNRVTPDAVSGGGRGTPAFDATDPRRLDRGDGGRAAILGAQTASNARRPPIPGTLGSGSFGVLNTTPVVTGQLGSGTFAIENAPIPTPPTSGTGGAVTNVPASVPRGPDKLPASGTSAPVTVRQAQEARLEQRLAASGAPVSSSVPTNQKIAREF